MLKYSPTYQKEYNMNNLLSTMQIVGIVFDVALVLVVLVYCIKGLKKGFIHSMVGAIGNVGILIGAIFSAKYIAGWLNKLYNFSAFFAGKITGAFHGEFYETVRVAGTEGSSLVGDIPDGTFGPLKTIIKKILNGTTFSADATVGEVLGTALGSLLFVIICGVLAFIVFKVVLAILGKIVDNATKGTSFGLIDKVLGFVFGAVKSAIVVGSFAVILVALTLIPTVNNFVGPTIHQHTYVSKYVYDVTDDLVEKYVINNVDDWLDNLWAQRDAE